MPRTKSCPRRSWAQETASINYIFVLLPHGNKHASCSEGWGPMWRVRTRPCSYSQSLFSVESHYSGHDHVPTHSFIIARYLFCGLTCSFIFARYKETTTCTIPKAPRCKVICNYSVKCDWEPCSFHFPYHYSLCERTSALLYLESLGVSAERIIIWKHQTL